MDAGTIFISDGGRLASGQTDESNDCAVVTLVTAFGWSYDEAHTALFHLGRRKGGGFPTQELFKRFDPKGFSVTLYKEFDKKVTKVPTIAEFAKANPKGIWILDTLDHVVTVNDGIVFDTSTKYKPRLTHIWKVEKR